MPIATTRRQSRLLLPAPGLLLLGALALAGRAGAQAGPGSQDLDGIRAAAITAIGAGDARAEATLDPSLRMTRCNQPLQAVASGPKTALVSCADTPGWRLYVPVRVRREANVVVLIAPAPSGVAIAASQLTVQRRDIGQASGAAFSDPAAVVGRMPRRALAAGQAPIETDLATGPLLHRGDPVVLVSRTGGVEVRVQGRVLGAQQASGIVAVENTSSHRIVRGRVSAGGEIEVTP